MTREPETGGPMTPTDALRWQVNNHEERLKTLESQNIAVLANRLITLEKRVDTLSRAAWSLAGALVLCAVTFALSVATGQIG